MTSSRKPTKYSAKQKKHIIGLTRKLLNEGLSLHKIAKRKDMPEARTLKAWLAQEVAARGAKVHKEIAERDLAERGEPNEKPHCPSVVMQVDVDTTKLQQALEELKNAANLHSRSEKEKLCEEFTRLMRVGVFPSHKPCPSSVLADRAEKMLNERLAEIRELVGQDYLDDFKERKALEKKMKELEDFAVATKECHRRRCAREFVFAVVLFGTAMLVVGSHLVR